MQTVKCLVQHRADVQAVDGYGRTSLHWSCKVANLDTSQFLIEHGADVMAVDWGMRTPLHWVCGGGLLQVQSRIRLAMLLLQRGASVHALDMQQCTPLHLACKGGLLELTSCLINLGALVDTTTDSGKLFLTDLLNKFVKKYILGNILQENAIVPYAHTGTPITLQLPRNFDIMQRAEPKRIHLFYVAGFHLSSILNIAMNIRRRDEVQDPSWIELLDFIANQEGQVPQLKHLCRLTIRAQLGSGIKSKLDELSILIPNSANNQNSTQQQGHKLLKLPTQLKDYITISEINN